MATSGAFEIFVAILNGDHKFAHDVSRAKTIQMLAQVNWRAVALAQGSLDPVCEASQGQQGYAPDCLSRLAIQEALASLEC